MDNNSLVIIGAGVLLLWSAASIIGSFTGFEWGFILPAKKQRVLGIILLLVSIAIIIFS